MTTSWCPARVSARFEPGPAPPVTIGAREEFTLSGGFLNWTGISVVPGSGTDLEDEHSST